jgi:putative oxidoreductase
MLRDLGILILRVVTGSLLMGHGSQKLFGWFGGGGVKGTAVFMEKLGIAPSGLWAAAAGAAEFTGGLLTVLGFLHPIGSIVMTAPMSIALGTAHAGKPIWSSQGGGEYPVTNIAIATSIGLTGPGRFSLDHILGIRVPAWVAALVGITTAFAIAERLSSARVQLIMQQQKPAQRVEQPAIAAEAPR